MYLGNVESGFMYDSFGYWIIQIMGYDEPNKAFYFEHREMLNCCCYDVLIIPLRLSVVDC